MSLTGNLSALLTFPCLYPLKVIGLDTPELELQSMQIIQQICPGDYQPISHLSRSGRYRSINLQVRLEDKEQLEALYQQLSTLPAVRTLL